MKKINKKAIFSISASLISILIGLILGLILLFIFDSDRAMVGFEALVGTGVSTPEKFAKVLYQAAPLILAGLSVAFAFKTGLFNIGAPGQYTIGAFCALFAAIVLGTPWYVSLIFAMIGGAIWGILPGLFKAHFNVNEVITCIMLNWIGLFLVNLLVSNIPQMLQNYWAGSITNRTVNLALVEKFYGVQTTIPKAGLDTLLGGSSYMNISIFIAIGIAIITYIILNKTTFGYELKACGYNPEASRYAGMSEKKIVILSMVISGFFSGIGGGLVYIGGTGRAFTTAEVTLPEGFNGIPVALLGMNSPLGCILAALFVSYINVGGNYMQACNIPVEIIDVISAVIIYFSSFALMIRLYLQNHEKKKHKKEVAVEGGQE